MSKNVIYDWQKWIDGYSVINEVTDHNGNLLTEMKQRIISFLSNQIKMAESGDPKHTLFDDIFGEPTPDNPRTRMLMPYGNKDVATMKLIMGQIREKMLQQVQQSQPGLDATVSWAQLEWKNEPTTVQQKMKPQGWLPGDPIPVVEKQVSNLTLNYQIPSTKDPNKQIVSSTPISRLIPKYAPEYVEWWQGNKAKDISGKQTFFSNNTQTVSEITNYVNETSISNIEYNLDKADNVVILSRHPIDVVRMSDFSSLDYSCHAPNGIYFECAMEEAKRTSSGGGVLFTIKAKIFNDRFPDGKIPQTGDLFNDRERGITDMLATIPLSRLRLRTITSDEETFAVPDRKIYGSQEESFRKETLQYFVKKQIDKFVDPISKKPILPKTTGLTRWGGSYEDVGDDRVGHNFFALMKNSLIAGGIDVTALYDDDEYGDEYTALVDHLLTDSIEWGGSPEEEQSNPKNDRCEQQIVIANQVISRFTRGTNYIKLFTMPNVDCDENGYTTISNAGFYVKLIVSKTTLNKKMSGLNDDEIRVAIMDILENMDMDEFPYSYTLSFAMTKTSINFYNDETVEFVFRWDADDYMDIDEFNEIATNFLDSQRYSAKREFDEEMTQLLRKNRVLDGGAAIYELSEEVDEFHNRIIETEFEYLEKQSDDSKLVYSIKHDVYRKPSEVGEFPEGINELANKKFVQLFSARANQIKSELNKQVKLFNLNPYDTQIISNKYLLPKLYDIKYIVVEKEIPNIDRSTFSATEYDIVTMNFTVILDTTLSEDELNFSMAFIEEIAQEPDSLYEIGEKAFYEVYAPYIKKERFKLKLSEGSKRKITIWKKNS